MLIVQEGGQRGDGTADRRDAARTHLVVRVAVALDEDVLEEVGHHGVECTLLVGKPVQLLLERVAHLYVCAFACVCARMCVYARIRACMRVHAPLLCDRVAHVILASLGRLEPLLLYTSVLQLQRHLRVELGWTVSGKVGASG